MAKANLSLSEEVKAMNFNCKNDRLRFVIDKLVDHLHAFVDETLLTAEEWSVAINFLAEAGRVSAETREDRAISKARGFTDAKPHAYIKRDFVLATPEQGAKARARESVAVNI